MTEQYVPLLVTFALAGIVVAVMVSLGHFVGPKTTSALKKEAFECGNPPSGGTWGRFSVKFYMVAILFLVFDVEIIFLYPWAVSYRQLGWLGLGEMLVFLGILTIGLLYVWRKGALELD